MGHEREREREREGVSECEMEREEESERWREREGERERERESDAANKQTNNSLEKRRGKAENTRRQQNAVAKVYSDRSGFTLARICRQSA